MHQDLMELCAISPRMTVTVTNRGLNGNELVMGKQGCCRGKNRVNLGGQDCRGRNDRML